MKLFKFSTASILLVLILCTTSLRAQVTSQQIDSIVNYAMTKFNVAGTAVAVVKDGKIIHNKGYGVKSIETNEPVDQHTQFAIASNSKAFVSAGLAILVEEGKIKWDDKVKTHIPEFTMYNDYVENNFTILDLITHRSGLPLGMGDLMFFPDGTDFTMEDLLSSFQHFKQASDFRTKWDYDNLLYLVAGELIARKSGMTWEAFTKTRILEPLGMDNSYSSLADIIDTSNLSASHSSDNGEIKVIPTFKEMMNGAAGGIFSNVDDLCQWLLLHLNGGKYGENLSNELFSSINHNEMWKIHTVMGVNKNPRYNSHFSGYGLGWFLSDVLGNMKVEHTGGLPGMLSQTILIPDMNLGLVILTNTSDDGGGLFSSVSQTILDMYFELDDFKWIDKYSAYLKSRAGAADDVTNKVWETVENLKDNPIDTKKYVGLYKDSWFGTCEVFMKENKLWLKFHRSPKLNGPLGFYEDETFAVKWEYQDMNADAFVTFTIGEDGNAESIKMKGISPNIDFSFDFHDLDLKREKQ